MRVGQAGVRRVGAGSGRAKVGQVAGRVAGRGPRLGLTPFKVNFEENAAVSREKRATQIINNNWYLH